MWEQTRKTGVRLTRAVFSKCHHIRSISINGGLRRNAHSGRPLRPTGWGTLRVGLISGCFNKPSRWFSSMFKFENRCSRNCGQNLTKDWKQQNQNLQLEWAGDWCYQKKKITGLRRNKKFSFIYVRFEVPLGDPCGTMCSR